jgi:ABC-type phosphate/phosphonate transport system substrate-binding protein
MSFLDNLENNLKSLESSEQGKDDAERAHRARENARVQAQAVAPFAEQLKNSPYTAELLTQAARVGFALRTKVHIAWLGSTLRLEARDKRLELRPTPQGIAAAYIENGQETRSEPCDLKGSPEELVRQWLA